MNSKQARAILAAVHALDHPTADEVFAQVRIEYPRVSLATVYRNLGRMVDEGRLVLRELGGLKRYDPNTSNHIHLHDLETDRLVDVEMTPDLKAAIQAICDQHQLDANGYVIELRGHLRGRSEGKPRVG